MIIGLRRIALLEEVRDQLGRLDSKEDDLSGIRTSRRLSESNDDDGTHEVTDGRSDRGEANHLHDRPFMENTMAAIDSSRRIQLDQKRPQQPLKMHRHQNCAVVRLTPQRNRFTPITDKKTQGIYSAEGERISIVPSRRNRTETEHRPARTLSTSSQTRRPGIAPASTCQTDRCIATTQPRSRTSRSPATSHRYRPRTRQALPGQTAPRRAGYRMQLIPRLRLRPPRTCVSVLSVWVQQSRLGRPGSTPTFVLFALLQNARKEE